MPGKMIKYGILALVLVALGAIVHVVTSSAAGPLGDPGAKAFKSGALSKLVVFPDPPEQPSESFTGPAGQAVSLADFRGKVVLVNIWATWCPPCVEEMPTLAALQDAKGGDAFQVLAVSVDRVPDEQMARDMLTELAGDTLTFYHDPNYQIAFAAEAQGFPTTILYGANGEELARLSGEADWASEEAKVLIDWAIAR